ncbi:hypothetical protein EIP86_000899 [Pleurotus ostreatoroseus]|nr:hypothetical protein EIP86_000899 [Pleurotus ostreatoroseus]
MASPTEFQEFRSETIKTALANSTLDGQFTDTAYVLYSRRFKDGKVGAPKRVYASSLALVAGGTHILAQLFCGSSTDQTFPRETNLYEYESDSDLDEDEELEQSGRDEHAHEGPHSENEEAESEETAEEKSTGNRSITTSSSEFADPRCRHNIVVPNVAANTWRALVYYIYTGKISFAPLRSKGISSRKNFIRNYHKIRTGLPTPVSPKSVYRLAHMYELEDLKKLAERDIKAKISAQNVVAEAFSWFSSE